MWSSPRTTTAFDHVEILSNHGDKVTGALGRLAPRSGGRLERHRRARQRGVGAAGVDRGPTARDPGRAVPNHLRGRAVGRLDRGASRRRRAVDAAVLVSRSAPSVHPTGPLRRHVRPGRRRRPFDIQRPAHPVQPPTSSGSSTTGATSTPPRCCRPRDEHQLRHAMAFEYGAITMIDEAVAEVLGALKRSGQAEDTIVVFTSDHGDMFGDHGLLLKMFVHYDGVLRVPFTISGPGITPGSTDSLLQLTRPWRNDPRPLRCRLVLRLAGPQPAADHRRSNHRTTP